MPTEFAITEIEIALEQLMADAQRELRASATEWQSSEPEPPRYCDDSIIIIDRFLRHLRFVNHLLSSSPSFISVCTRKGKSIYICRTTASFPRSFIRVGNSLFIRIEKSESIHNYEDKHAPTDPFIIQKILEARTDSDLPLLFRNFAQMTESDIFTHIYSYVTS